MSQPHDGHRTFLPFGNPFRMIFPKGSYVSPKFVVLLTSFEQTLADGFKKLKPKDISDVRSLLWMRHAMEFLSEMHTDIKTLITDLQFPVSDWDEKWIDIYFDSSVKLLDICIALSSELSRLDQGQLLLKYVLHNLDLSGNSPSSEQLQQAQASLYDWMQQMSSQSTKLEVCSVILQGLAGTVYSAKVKNSAKGKVLMRALHGVKVGTIFLCSVLTAALWGCPKPLIEMHAPDQFLWAKAFKDLQADVLKEMTSHLSGGNVTVLKELAAVGHCVERLCSSTGPVGPREQEILSKMNHVNEKESTGLEEERRSQEPVSELAEGAERLAQGLDLLSKQVGDFFQIVLTGRDGLLCNLRASDDVIMQEPNVETI